MCKLYFCIGLSRSGKSNLSKKWLRYDNHIYNGKFQDYICSGKDKEGWLLEPSLRKSHIEEERRVVVSGDEIRNALYGSNWNSLCEDYVDAIKWTMVRALLSSGHTVLLDETNTSERSIRKILEIDINAQFAFVETTPEICHRRADESAGPYSKSLLHKPIDRMEDNLTTLAFQYAWEDENMMLPDWLNLKDVKLIIIAIKENLIRHKREFTNETIRENSKLPKMPTLPTDSCPSVTYSGPVSPEPTYQVW